VAGDLFQHDGCFDVAQTEPTPLLPDGDPEQVGRGQGGQSVSGQLPRPVGVTSYRCHGSMADVAGQRPQGLLVVRLGERVCPSGGGHGRTDFLTWGCERLEWRTRHLAGPDALP